MKVFSTIHLAPAVEVQEVGDRSLAQLAWDRGMCQLSAGASSLCETGSMCALHKRRAHFFVHGHQAEEPVEGCQGFGRWDASAGAMKGAGSLIQ